MNPPLAFHREATAVVAASPQELFAFLDDHQRLSAHMQKPSLMMAGATMKIDTDSQRGQAVGSRIRMFGRVLGIPLSVDETVIDYAPPFRKSWQTCGEPRLWAGQRQRAGFCHVVRYGLIRIRSVTAPFIPNKRPEHGTQCSCQLLAQAVGVDPRAISFGYCSRVLQKRWHITCTHGALAIVPVAIRIGGRWSNVGGMDPVRAILMSNDPVDE